jgi:hypothetical protein
MCFRLSWNLVKKLDVSRTSLPTIIKNDMKKFKAWPRLRKLEGSKNADSSSLGTLVITSSFPSKNLFLLQETHNQQNNRVYSVSLRNIPLVPLVLKCIQSHGMGCHVEKRQVLFIKQMSKIKINQDFYIEHVWENLWPTANNKKKYTNFSNSSNFQIYLWVELK